MFCGCTPREYPFRRDGNVAFALFYVGKHYISAMGYDKLDASLSRWKYYCLYLAFIIKRTYMRIAGEDSLPKP